MIARAGGLDQGNIIANLIDAEQRGLTREHFVSAVLRLIRSRARPASLIQNSGAEAMQQPLKSSQW